MRTYAHAILTLVATQRYSPQSSVSAALGAVLPDLAVGAGAVWLWAKRGLFTRDQFQQEACAKGSFATPDAALHSVVPLGAGLIFCFLPGIENKSLRQRLLAFLLGWAGHVISDALTHGEDARPFFWPLSARRFSSPVSYWENKRYGRLFTTLEHMVVVLAGISLLTNR